MNTIKLLHRCPQCKRLFALKKQQKNVVKEEKVKILKSVMQLNQRGEAEKMGDCYVDGKRVTYEILYTCKRCGEKHVMRIVKEKQGKSAARI